MTSVADQILDDLIPHDVQVRRAIGSEQRKVDARLRALENEMVARFLSNPPKTEAGVVQFMKRMRPLIAETFREQSVAYNEALRGVARAENEAVNGAVETVING